MQKRPVQAGSRFGRLTVQSELTERSTKGEYQYACMCECGTDVIATGAHLRSGGKRSCGCYKRDITSARRITHGHTARQFGTHKCSPEYVTWAGIKQRCTNPNEISYQWYGGRGIQMCQEWQQSFGAFLAHVGIRPSPNHSIDRIDNSRGYEPDNVRWATGVEQCANKRNNHMITYRGRTQTLAQWARENGLTYRKLSDRINKLHWPVEKALHWPSSSPS